MTDLEKILRMIELKKQIKIIFLDECCDVVVAAKKHYHSAVRKTDREIDQLKKKAFEFGRQRAA